MEYDDQLEQKEQLVRELFGDVKPIIGCESPWHWRNKMEFSFSQNKAGDRFLGLMMRGKRGRVVTLDECLLTSHWFVNTLKDVLAWWEETELEAYFPPANRGELRTLMLREGIQTGEKMVVLGVMGDAEIEGFEEAVGEVESVMIRRQYAQKGVPTRFEEELIFGRDHIFEELFDYRFKVRAASFFQPNTKQAEILYETALAELEEVDLLLDLYCGIGSIGIVASEKAKRVIGVEIVPEAVEAARENVALNGVNMEIIEGDVEKCLEEIGSPDCVILDPPRCGLSKKCVEKVLSLGAKKIIYISCNPKSQKKNIDQMEGYRVEWVQPVDQFPHTAHIENIVCLERDFLI
ncbi:MAG: 23S rRNA (uracil-C(5))-methyltransferase RlmCD [Chlamydiales bacterium]|nr:23S rRNA (uracil-C(5))-methyltransferase RlmCD [Chlamydiales bacterium]MCH9619831.1 23S rRNA (uracil-C(5))-methyltransferase RlmCD [Chlamydiales bacterium]MCH9622742.1 23S rRNA (uracil-C(5))-methyltransferase RlmCD [Chlamydiales bacterium]